MYVSFRSGETSAKYAVGAIRKKFYHDNPHVVMFALQVSNILLYTDLAAITVHR